MLISPANTSQYAISGLQYYYSFINKRSCPNLSSITTLNDISGNNIAPFIVTSCLISSTSNIPSANLSSGTGAYITGANTITISTSVAFEYFFNPISTITSSHFFIFISDSNNDNLFGIFINNDYSVSLYVTINNTTSLYRSQPYSVLAYLWNHLIITYTSGSILMYINNNQIYNSTSAIAITQFTVSTLLILEKISTNMVIGFTRLYVNNTTINTVNYNYVQTLYRNAFPNITSGGTFTNLAISALSYNSVTFVPTYTGFSQASVSLAISVNQNGTPALSGYLIPDIASGSSNLLSTLTQNTPYFGVLTSGSAIFSRLFVTYVNYGSTFAASCSASTYNSGSISITTCGYPSGTLSLSSSSNVTLSATSIYLSITVPYSISFTYTSSTTTSTTLSISFSVDTSTASNYGQITSSSSIIQGTPFSFNNGNGSGYSGPTSVSYPVYYSVTLNSGYQYWTIPSTGYYTITLAGAGNTNSSSNNPIKTGYGIVMNISSYQFTANTYLVMLVGQQGLNVSGSSGGAGGTFIGTSTSSNQLQNFTLLFVAGGAGGIGGESSNGANANLNATMSTTGQNGTGGDAAAGGVGPNGGSINTLGAYQWADAGAGYIGNSGWGGGGCSQSFVNGGTGGTGAPHPNGAYGGFGGGGSGGAYWYGVGGGGGGYGGGGSGSSDGQGSGGGGGGSYDITGAYSGSAANSGMGYITITFIHS